MKWLAALLMFAAALPAFAQGEKPTLVSLDYCADQFVLGLADREQILALSPDAEKPFSYLREKAAGIPKVQAMAEDVIALQPDMVVRSWGGDARSLAFYQRLGIETVQLGYASDMEGAKNITRAAGEALGQAARAEALIAAMPPPAAPSGKSALYLTPGGVTTGAGTMMDAILKTAGLENAAKGAGWMDLPLEQLVLSPPDLSVTAFFGFGSDAQDRWSVARHPVMRRILKESAAIDLTESRLTCPAWFVADEAAALAEKVK